MIWSTCSRIPHGRSSALAWKQVRCRNGCSVDWRKQEFPAICIETRHAKAFLKAQVNKSDRNDARGIAQMMRVNLFRPVHVKTLTSQKCRALLTARKILQEKAVAVESDIRGLLRNFGLKVGIVGVGKFERTHTGACRRHARTRRDHGSFIDRSAKAP